MARNIALPDEGVEEPDLGWIVAAAKAGAGTVNVSEECDGTTMHVAVGIRDDHREPGPDWNGVVISPGHHPIHQLVRLEAALPLAA